MTAQARRELATAILLCLAGGALVLLAAGRVWIRVRQPGALPPLDEAYTGGELDSGATALGLLGLAAIAALVATRRWGRVVIGALLAAVSTGLVVAVVVTADAAADPYPGQVSGLISEIGGQVSTTTTAWPWVTAAGGGLIVAGGALTAVRGRGWAVLSQRYDAPAGRTLPRTDDWSTLDRGEDPTI